MIVQPGSTSRLAHRAFCGNDDDVRRANNIAFQRSGGLRGSFFRNSGKTSLARVFGRRVAASAVAFRDVTRRKETMRLAVLRYAGAMKISTASLQRGAGKINITFSKREGGREREN